MAAQDVVWTDRDSALWHTCEVAADLMLDGCVTCRLEVLSPFPPSFSNDERVLASGVYQLHQHLAPGDGTYLRESGYFFATGPLGLALTAASLAGRAAGNRSRRLAAQAAATPRWVVTETGTLHVSTHGFYLHGPHGLAVWSWSGVSTASMVGPAAVHLLGTSTTGPVSWVVESDWSELLFLLWAATVHPRHPQLVAGGWLPPGWLEWARAYHPSRLTHPSVAIG